MSELRLPRVSSPAAAQHAASSSHAAALQPPPLPPSDFADTANPFIAPTADLFQLKSRDQQQKAEAKQSEKSLRIWEKPAKAASASAASTGSSSYLQRTAARNAFLASSSSSSASLPSSSPADVLRSSTDARFYPTSSGRSGDKLNMASFIAGKRDMFLLHMSLATKRGEMTKLEEKAGMKEEALRRAEQMLEEDAMRFDAFLKENDRRAHESLKRADKESKEKTERVVEMKRVNAEIAKVEADMSKHEEQLVNCMKYKTFLDGLTDSKWLEREETRRQNRREERRRKKEEKKRVKSKAKDRAPDGSPVTHRKRAEGAVSNRNVSINRGSDEKEALSPRSRQQAPLSSRRRPATSASSSSSGSGSESGSDSDSGHEEAMYFTSPQQLLDIFSQLEERNLFLIQNVQETEESLEEMRARYAEMEADMSEKAQQLTASIDDMRRKIEKEQEKTEQLMSKKTVMGIVGGGADGGVQAERIGDALREQVRAVYRKSGFDADSATDTLDMLRDIEGWLEHLLHEMKSMDPLKVEQAEKVSPQQQSSLRCQLSVRARMLRLGVLCLLSAAEERGAQDDDQTGQEGGTEANGQQPSTLQISPAFTLAHQLSLCLSLCLSDSVRGAAGKEHSACHG